MEGKSLRVLDPALLAGGLVIVAAAASPACAAEPAALSAIQDQLARQNARIDEQERKLAEQAALIEAQGVQIEALRVEREQILSDMRAGRAPEFAPGGDGAPPIQLAARQDAAPPTAGLPGAPVGQAPPATAIQRKLEREVAAVPHALGVLTPKGALVVEPNLEYTVSSANRLVFRGVEIVPGVQLGVIDANDADREAVVGTMAARYGLGDRWEIEARIPYVYRHDRVTTLAQRDESVTRTTEIDVNDIGDIEFDARYQINRGLNGRPIFVAAARVKPPTGKSPYDVDYDQFGVATSLATGSGFWGAELGVTMLYPTDPAVIYAGLSYLYNVPKDINKLIGEVHVGEVDPGDAVSLNVGFGMALNPRFSVSFGYAHHFITGSKTELNDTRQSSNSLQVGALQLGWSFRFSDRLTLVNSFEFGVTADTPDMRATIRLPYRF